MKLQFILPLLFILLAFVGHSVAQDEETRTELGKRLREHLDEVLEKIKEAIVKEIQDHLRQDVVEKIKERIQKQKDRINGTVGANP
ncbi:unnamed protein product [Caenorhabditis brenneri]